MTATKAQAAEILRMGLDDILDRLNRIGLPGTTRDDQWKATIVLRNVDNDQQTIAFGHDDEATLIVALQILGAAKGRANYTVNHLGMRKNDQ